MAAACVDEDEARVVEAVAKVEIEEEGLAVYRREELKPKDEREAVKVGRLPCRACSSELRRAIPREL